ncbi:uncharacterized protein LOC142771521 [Rhipicephalus microplus]|uniref:uncharacterized protein LOC142771521 n=1 Tax=Rhipicephalus microplus TaxID=6941 RepID=UPI003F6C2F75
MAGRATARWSAHPAQLLAALLLATRSTQAGLLESLCALLGEPELCRNDDGAKSSWEDAATTWGPFQPIADASDPPLHTRDIPWRPGRIVIKGKRTARLDSVFRANHSLPSPETNESLQVDFDNVTYSVDDPRLPWKILEYFANLQVEVSYVENVEKRKAYSRYLFRQMNVYLYSVAGADATVKLAPRGYFSPEFFVGLVNKLSMILVLVMTGMLLWFIGFLAYWFYSGGTDSSPTASDDYCGLSELSAASATELRSRRVATKATGRSRVRSRSCDDDL